MKKDQFRDDGEEIHNLDDLIEARDPTPHASDLGVPEDTDIDEALTFPHPHHDQHEKHKEIENIELMDTPNERNMDEDWADQDLLPSDYAHGYDEATTTDLRDDNDEIAEDAVHMIDHPSLDEMSEETPVETMPDVFTPDEEDSIER
jgi:hypothetical protein